MTLTYVAMPHTLAGLGWIVYNRQCARPAATALSASQAKTLAALLNLAAGWRAPHV